MQVPLHAVWFWESQADALDLSFRAHQSAPALCGKPFGQLALGVLNFVVQPIWRAAAVTSALALAEVKSEAEEKRAVAKARSKEKAEARLRRVAVAVPVVGLAAATAFEYAAYQRWQAENPSQTFDDYAAAVLASSQEVAGEVAGELTEVFPQWATPDVNALMQAMEAGLQNLRHFSEAAPTEAPE